jgi:hypothetical protein
MRKIAAVVNPHLPHQAFWCGAMADGILRHGIAVDVCSEGAGLPDCDAVACWGWRIAKTFVNRGYPTLVLERGYIGDRERWTSAGWNGLNGRASFPIPDGGADRFGENFGSLLQPWDDCPIGYALIMGQVPGDQTIAGLDVERWKADLKIAFAEKGMLTRFRPHPLDHPPANSLEGDLADAAIVATWNSNSGVDAILAGKPVLAMDRGSMAWDVASHSVAEGPIRPDRKAWAEKIAWAQWSHSEMSNGTAWQALASVEGVN